MEKLLARQMEMAGGRPAGLLHMQIDGTWPRAPPYVVGALHAMAWFLDLFPLT